LHYSVRTGHPGFSNQLYGDQDAAGLLGEWMTALLNTSMYTYEVAPVVTLMELELMRQMCAKVGWDDDVGEGVLAPGASIANLMALLAARHRFEPKAKREGLFGGEPLVLFTSCEGHYSIDRAASIAGLGTAAVRKIDVDEVGRMRPESLVAEIERARAEGARPFFVCATASTTVAGAFDPIPEIADIAQENELWLHLDAACGGGVLLSESRRHLMRGSERADSVAWNPHKMMGVPLACSALLLRERGWLEATNGMGADYLFHDGDDANYDLGDRTLQCGRRVDALKLWLSWCALGDEGHAKRIDSLFGIAHTLRGMIAERANFELVRQPQGCNTCFHFVPPSLRGLKPGKERGRAIGEATVEIRERLVEDGRLLINYAPLDGVSVFRHVASNHRVTEEDLVFLLDEIERHGSDL
jgi:glutamate/tyrosine decarboxylase-like PLP-dependent enzyme